MFGTDLVEVIVFTSEKGTQYRLSVTDFRGTLYFGLREWYQGFEGEMKPTDKGMTIPYTLASASGLFRALASLLSKAEVLNEVNLEVDFCDTLLKQASVFAAISKASGVLYPEQLELLSVNDDTVTLRILHEKLPKDPE